MRVKSALLVTVLLLSTTLGCSRQRQVPTVVPPPLPDPETRLYQRPFPIVWDTVRVDLANDDTLEADTIDKAGRFVAWEKRNSFFLLRGRRNVVTIELEPVGDRATRMVLQMSAQRYEAGGLRRPADWYPDRSVNEGLGEAIATRIDRRLDHTPGLADEAAREDIERKDPLPPEPSEYKPRPDAAATSQPATSADEQPSVWRRFWPFGRS